MSAARPDSSPAWPAGAALLAGGGVRFRLWAPRSERVSLEIYGSSPAAQAQLLPMSRDAEGWHDVSVIAASVGTRYRFVLPDGMRVPDPASRFQPDDVHGPSEVIDPTAYRWGDSAWAGRPWHDTVIYELHVGTFTGEGTFRAAIERLEHLATLGITAIQLMPVADFPGRRNWGYDGVLFYAPDSVYGRPEDLKALIDAAHAHGIMVILDVVYNHFGPDGNYLPVYAPDFFTDRHTTPWGAALNFDGAHSRIVREFIIQNALYWTQEFHVDGLRLDAVHAILDDSERDLLDELAARVRAGRRTVHLILENEENQSSRLERGPDGVPLSYTAQWNDDVHHVLHVAATNESAGYYAEYRGDTEKLGRALAEGFAFQGQTMQFRGTARGAPSAHLPPTAFVAFIQNHDQIGNRAFGERLTALARPQAVRALIAVYLLLPQVPMLFMGEEWRADEPFPFFCDFAGDLAEAVRQGRRAEFARFPEFLEAASRERIPDPGADSTFASAKLDWSALNAPAHAAWLELYRRLLAVRHESVVPVLPLMTGNSGRYHVLGAGAVRVSWQWQNPSERGQLTLTANLTDQRVGGVARLDAPVLWQEGAPATSSVAEPWSACWQLTRQA